ncbi:oxidoreductase [Mycolicibacterium mucogenicum]|uniref:SDR family NAD(P)-dependent oxidoreductase n=2 Tax=Mycolicibacterium mucogenicum TaxID=56689 RepID=A0A8H2JAQ4_MYCMU|nr:MULTISPECIES: SDR family oxidoreductase [Mycobacteriaceae]KAB7759112.1 oxidoreductase [Mycolicibacterium mucogenicum DSM 44124]OBJ39241.1 oxidoreductase [Mycolicibacterium mucogenicum]QPG71044.1 SDR family oxidoreductase [Mycolicibacterium mucogenicum DSM 44124]
MSSLSGRVALITGASAGLGAATVKVFAERGASVFGIARDAERMATVFADAYGDEPGGAFAAVDISTADACRQAVEDCIAKFGRLDVLVNVAGFHVMRHTLSVTDEDWDRDLAVNLNGPFYLTRAALPQLLENGGNIVNVSSIAGVEGEIYSAGYCAAKHGLIGLTRALAVEYTKEKLRVNAVCPGGMLTAQVTEFAAPENADWDLIMRIAAPRGFMEPRDVANVIAFLASDDAAAIHGSVYRVDNGKGPA